MVDHTFGIVNNLTQWHLARKDKVVSLITESEEFYIARYSNADGIRVFDKNMEVAAKIQRHKAKLGAKCFK
jgi:hypothetical protein